MKDDYCISKEVKGSYLVSIREGQYLDSTWNIIPEKLNFINKVYNRGQIFCTNKDLNFTIFLPKPENFLTNINLVNEIKINKSVTFFYKNQTEINLKLNENHNYFGIKNLNPII